MSFVVRVEYQDYDQDRQTEIHGPYVRRETAAGFVKKIARALGTEYNEQGAYTMYTLPEADGSVFVSIQPVMPARVRPIAASVKEFIQGLIPEDDE